KLANVAHRTELGAVRVGVEASELKAAVEELQHIAAQQGVSDKVAIQPMVKGDGEVFIGVKNDTALGPIVVVGLGGILVEVLQRVVGRLLPVDREMARE